MRARATSSDEEWDDEEWQPEVLPGTLEIGEAEEPACLLDRWGDPIEPTRNPLGFNR